MADSVPLNPQELLMKLFRSALDSADPHLVIPANLPAPPKGRTVVVGVGKAAAAMAESVERHWKGPLCGAVVVPPGATRSLKSIQVLTGSHPVPDESSVFAANVLLKSVDGLTSDDLVIALISGGGSALCASPALGLTLVEKQNITRALLLNGASISEINVVRRHLSAIKGGRLAARAFPAKVVTLLISDIPGDEPSLIASGPTLADESTCQDAKAVLTRYGVRTTPAVQEALSDGRWESVKSNDLRLQNNRHVLIASAWDGMTAAALRGASLGWQCHILSDAMEGEARELAKAHSAMALSIVQRQTPFNAPCILISGGEATVTVRGRGRGGRNTEFALAMAMAMHGQNGADRIHVLSAGTDGLDGNANAAGAFVDAKTIGVAMELGMNAGEYLDDNDSATFLKATNSLIHTGPTFTNINDFRAVLIT